MFMRFGAAEKAGSGVNKIIKGWASQHWRAPLVRKQQQPDRVYWELLMIRLIPNELSKNVLCFSYCHLLNLLVVSSELFCN